MPISLYFRVKLFIADFTYFLMNLINVNFQIQTLRESFYTTFGEDLYPQSQKGCLISKDSHRRPTMIFTRVSGQL